MNKKLKKQELPKVIFTDFDGCLTDDRVWLNQDGEEFIAANRKDGLAISRLKNFGIKVVITSTETNKVVSARAHKLGIESLQGLSDKVVAIQVQFSMCPKDAVKTVKNEVDLILKTNGGYGILSEIATSLEAL